MVEKSSFTMPKTAFIILYLFCGNFILSGKSVEHCPKNPLVPTNSISGMVVGVIVGTEKVINGVISYFWYLGENSVNQVLSVSSQFEGFLSQITIKIHNFASGLIGGVGGQLKTIYNGSTGSIRLLFDSVIRLENSAQSFLYKQLESFSNKVVSGKLTGEITSVVKSPFSSIASGLKKVKYSVSKLSQNVAGEIKKMTDSVKTSGIPSDIKGIIGAPVKGVQEFSKEAQSVLKTVKDETSQRFSGYSSEFKNGGVIDKVVAVGSIPVGVGLEVWSFGLKMSDAAVKSVSISVKDIVQPFLGPVLTERLGTVVMLPMRVIEGFYKSTLNFFNQIEGIISKITGGGRLSVQINMIVKHPIVVLENIMSTTKQELKGFSKAILGEGLTEQLSSALGSPEKALSKLFSSLTGGQLSITLHSFIRTPMLYLETGINEIKKTIGGITKGIIGAKWTTKLSNILNAPGKSLSHLISTITGGGNLSELITTSLTRPMRTLEKTWTVLKTNAEETLKSITGGGSLGAQISTVLTKPTTLLKNLWNTINKTMEALSKTLLGGSLTNYLKHLVSSPVASISKLFKSISSGFSGLFHGFGGSINFSAGGSAGGGIGGAISSLIHAPMDLFKGILNGARKAETSVMNSLKGFYQQLPIIGKGASVKGSVNFGGEVGSSGISLGGGVSGKSTQGKLSGGAKLRRRRRRIH